MDTPSGLTACDYCGAIQMFRSPDAARLPAPKSERITLEQTAEGTRIRYRWISAAKVFLVIFGLLLACQAVARRGPAGGRRAGGQETPVKRIDRRWAPLF